MLFLIYLYSRSVEQGIEPGLAVKQADATHYYMSYDAPYLSYAATSVLSYAAP